MAVRHRLINARPSDVWEVLADGRGYPRWVVGPSAAEPVCGQWPHTGAAIRYEVQNMRTICDTLLELGRRDHHCPV